MAKRPRNHRDRVCSWCSKSFTKDEHFTRHVRTHTREKPFICTICRKAFSRHDSLLRHSRSHQSSSISLTGAALATENDTIHLPLNSHDQQVSSFNENYPMGIHDPPPPPSRLSPTESRCQYVSNDQPGTSQSTNLSQDPSGLRANVEELVFTEGGVAGFPTPSSQPNMPTLDPGLHHSSQDDSWVLGNSTIRTPPWFADDNFDLTALNSEILMSTGDWFPSVNASQYQHEQEPVGQEPVGQTSQPAVEDALPSRENEVQTHWYTFMGKSPTGHITPDVGSEQTQVDDAYRASLVAKLQPHLPVMPLPSTDFLNLCIHMYFTKFHPSFPIVHASTFRPSSKSSLLLLSICSIGSLFVGSSHAASQGIKIFETLNKAVLASWERYFSKEGPETTAMIQAALIGQTFGLLSGRRKDLLIAQTFHGTLIAWARRANSSKLRRKYDQMNLNQVTHTPAKAWKDWIQTEEQNRLLAGIHVHDVELSELFLTDPYLRHSPAKLPLLCDDDLWAATTVEDWGRKFASRLPDLNITESNVRSPGTTASHVLPLSTPPSNDFRFYVELEGLAASAIEAKISPHDSKQQKSFEGTLMTFHQSHIRSNRGQTPDPYCLPVLWHSIFVSLYTDINRLELVIGKEGFTEAQNHVAYARSWASSLDGQRCALHAALILRELEQHNVGTEPPIHVPRIIFRATLVWFCYTNFGSDTANSHQSVEFPELQKIGVNASRLLFEANGFKLAHPTTSDSSTFCGLADMLSRVGHWGVSQLFASIVNLLLPSVKDN